MKDVIPKQVADYANDNALTSSKYVGWISVDKELLLRVFAFRRTKKHDLEIREVIRASTGEEKPLYRDMYLTTMCGWRVFYRPSEATVTGWYGYTYYSIEEENFDEWEETDHIPGVYYEVINKDSLLNTEFMYCGYSSGNIVAYIKLWRQHPCVEYFGKAGIKPSKAVINQLERDKNFGKWVGKQNTDELRLAGAKAILHAYKHHIELSEAIEVLKEKNEAIQMCKHMPSVKRSGLDKIKVFRYVRNRCVGTRRYDDYIEACIGLGLDLNDTKNAFPNDFTRMHDLRTSQYGANKNKTKSKNFKEAALKYLTYEYSEDTYCVIIPKGIRDLQREGRELDHCVGKMGYDQRMIKGISFIAFIREREQSDVPFVTVEFDMRLKKIAQIYGIHDSKPSDNVISFSKRWETKVKNELKKANA